MPRQADGDSTGRKAGTFWGVAATLACLSCEAQNPAFRSGGASADAASAPERTPDVERPSTPPPGEAGANLGPSLSDAAPVHSVDARTLDASLDLTAPPRVAGLRGEYFDNEDLTALRATRVDPTINFFWTIGPPTLAVGIDTFSVRWTGTVTPRYSELYSFHTVTDDGARLWIDDTLIINNWNAQPASELTGRIRLEAGRPHAIRMEYFDATELAIAVLRWSSASQSKEVIPDSALSTPAP